MLEGVSVVELVDWGGWGVMALAVALGWLIPRWTHNQRISDKEAQIDYLREIVEKREAQLEIALSNSDVVIKLLEDIKQAGKVS